MKKLFAVLGLAVASVSVHAQDYISPLQNTWTAFDTVAHENFAKKEPIANKLALIAKKWNTEWITHYYASLAKTEISYNERDAAKHDAILNEAEKEHDEAVSILGKENDETLVLAAMIANSRLAVDPMNRWQKYGKIFSDDLEAAKAINANNPRIYYMKAISVFFTPKAFGGGNTVAQPYFEKAEALFAKEPGNDINKPSWGKKENNFFLVQCKTPDKDEAAH